ncbi:MAG: hypothetical protein GY856_12745 [bacterium]|nr:hypothetical protein [bacterium]
MRKMELRSVLLLVLVGLVLQGLGELRAAEAQETEPSREEAEELGIELPAEGPAAPQDRVLADLLLIPESTNDRVMSFDPTTGNLIDADFIPADPTHLALPGNAILSSAKNTILVSDQVNDVVQEYAMNGTYIGVFAPAGGLDRSILNNIRGITLRANGNLLVAVGEGGNVDAVAEFDTAGTYLGNFVTAAAGGLDSPFDVLLTTDVLVSGTSSDAIHRYNVTTGAYIADLTAIDSFPEQLALAANGNILVANYSGTQVGVVEFTAAGALVGVYNPATLTGYRGVYELPNGNLLTTTSTGVHEIDRLGNLVESKITGVSARYIELIEEATPVELLSFTVE